MVVHVDNSILAETFDQHARGLRRPPTPGSSSDSDVSDISATSSVCELQGSFAFVGQHDDRVPCESAQPYKTRMALHLMEMKASILWGVGSQFDGVQLDRAPVALRGNNLSFNPKQSLRLPHSHAIDHCQSPRSFLSNLPLPPTSLVPSIVLLTKSIFGTPPSNQRPYSPIRPAPSGVLQQQPAGEAVHSGVATRLPGGSRRRRIPNNPNYLNPLLVLDPEKFGRKPRNTDRCLGCYTSNGIIKPSGFIRAIFNQIAQPCVRNYLEITEVDITTAKTHCDSVNGVKAKLRVIWDLIADNGNPFPAEYPVAAEDHEHKTKVKRDTASHSSSVSMSLAETALGNITASQPTNQSYTPPSAVPPEPPQLEPLAVQEDHIPPFHGPAQDFSHAFNYDTRYTRQNVDILCIGQDLHCLSRMSEDPLSAASAVESAIYSIRSFLDFTKDIMFPELPLNKAIADANDFSGWSAPLTTELSHLYIPINMHHNFIDAIEQRLKTMHQAIHMGANKSQQTWSSSVLDIVLQKVRSIVDEQMRRMIFLSPPSHNNINHGNIFHSSPHAPGQPTTASVISGPSTGTSVSNAGASLQSNSTAPTTISGTTHSGTISLKPARSS